MKVMLKSARKLSLCLVFYLASSMLFSGCWSRTEPKNLSVLNSVLFDKMENGDIRITKECMKPSGGPSGPGGGESEKSSVDLFVSEGKTMAEAVRDELNGRILFGGNLKARMFTEKYAKWGLVEAMDFLARDHLVDETPYLAVVKGEKPELVYNSDVALSEMVGNYISDMAHTQPSTKSESVYVTNLDFLKDYLSESKQPVMGLIEVKENEAKPIVNPTGNSQSTQSKAEKDYMLVYSGLAAFRDDKLVGYLDRIETRAYNFLVNKLKSAVISLPDGITAVKVTKSGSKIKTEVENGQSSIHVQIKVAFSVIQVGEAIDADEIPQLKTLEQKFNEQLKTEISSSIEKAQKEFQSDIFGFGTYIRIQHPKEWKNMKSNWDELFSQATVDVKVNSIIVMSGEAEQSLKMEKESHGS
jgi:spore germination protein KC